jgi:hypothetical protein
MEEFEFEFIPDFGPEFDEDIERTAFENTYKVLIGVTTVDKLLDKESMQKGSIDQHITTPLLFNPTNTKTSTWTADDDLIDDMISYYTETEEYEKCAKLVKLKKQKQC